MLIMFQVLHMDHRALEGHPFHQWTPLEPCHTLPGWAPSDAEESYDLNMRTTPEYQVGTTCQ